MTKKQQRLRRTRQTPHTHRFTQNPARLTVNRTNLHIYASVVSGDGAKVQRIGLDGATRRAQVTRQAQAIGKRPLLLGCRQTDRQKKPKTAGIRKLLIARVMPITAASKR